MNLLLSGKRWVARGRSLLVPPLGQRLPLRTNFAWTFAGNTLYAASQWGILAVMAKLGSPEMVGQFSLATAICTPIIMFSNLQLGVIQATDVKDEYQFADYLGLRLVCTALAWLVIAGVAVVSAPQRQTLLIIVIIGLAKAFEAVSDIIYGLLQKHERMDRIATSKVIKGAFSLLLLGALIWKTRSLVYGSLGMAAVWLGLLFAYDLGNARRLAPVRAALQKNTIRRLVWLALPMGLVMMLISLYGNIPRYFVQYYGRESELGYYSALAYLMVVGNMIVAALGQSATPRLSQHYSAVRRRAYVTLTLRLVALGFAVGAAGIVVAALWGRPILTVLYRPDYAEYTNVFLWLAISAALSNVNSFLGYAMSAARRFRIQAPLFAVVTLSATLACLWLVPRYGLVGAAQATAVANLMNILGCLAVLAHAVKTIDRPAHGVTGEAG